MYVSYVCIIEMSNYVPFVPLLARHMIMLVINMFVLPNYATQARHITSTRLQMTTAHSLVAVSQSTILAVNKAIIG